MKSQRSFIVVEKVVKVVAVSSKSEVETKSVRESETHEDASYDGNLESDSEEDEGEATGFDDGEI